MVTCSGGLRAQLAYDDVYPLTDCWHHRRAIGDVLALDAVDPQTTGHSIERPRVLDGLGDAEDVREELENAPGRGSELGSRR